MNTMAFRILSAGTAFFAALCAVNVSRGGFDDLLVHVPPDANALVLVNAKSLYQSSLAKKEDWAGQHAKGRTAGGMLLPKGTSRIVVGTVLDYQYMHAAWEAAVIEMDSAPSPATIAERDGGKVDMIGQTPTVMLPGDATLIEFDKGIVGIMSPANRQRAAEWINYRSAELGPSRSPFLQHAAEEANTARGQIFLAFDLHHLLSASDVYDSLQQVVSLKDRTTDLAKLSELLAGVQGVMIGILVDDSRHGKMVVEFADDASLLGASAKPLVLETLAGVGAMIDDFSSWTASVDGNEVSLEGDLSETGMRRLMSLIALPTHWMVEAQAPTAIGSGTPSETTPYASLAYFQSIQKIVRELQDEKMEAITLGQVALWFDMYANNIDRLPKVNVDAELLDYGAGTAELLRQAALAMRGIGIQSQARESQIYPQLSGVYTRTVYPRYYHPYTQYGYGSPYGRYGNYRSALYFQYRNVTGEQRAVRAQEVAKGATAEANIMEQIANAGTKIRDTMSKKYNLDF